MVIKKIHVQKTFEDVLRYQVWQRLAWFYLYGNVARYFDNQILHKDLLYIEIF